MGAGVNRVQALVSRMFTVALDRSLVEAHPATRMIKRSKEQPRERTLTDEEVRELWIGLKEKPGPASDAVQLRLLLGQRGVEVNGMRWADVDLGSATWVMPGEVTKNGRPHTVALPPAALKLLNRCRAEAPEGEASVFPGLSMQSKVIGSWRRFTKGSMSGRICVGQSQLGEFVRRPHSSCTQLRGHQHRPPQLLEC